ncbi:MAG TPA: CHAP domain-containing protein, partial [Myxococcota bacterium]|nr:CHAP domain-containing protein [Myxococcota bacterium]
MSALARSPAPREKAAPSYPAERQAAAGGRMGLQQAGGGGNELVQQRLAAQEKEGDPGAADAPVGSPAGGTDGMGDGGGRPDGWGTPLASHRGVTAFSNGGDVNYGERSTYGLSYQCVEYVNRFASEALGLGNMAGTGNAKDYAGEGRSGLTWVPNVPGPHLPTDGDILVFQGGTYGHVAVATSGGPGGVRMIQQNSRSVYGDLGVTGGEGSWSVKA